MIPKLHKKSTTHTATDKSRKRSPCKTSGSGAVVCVLLRELLPRADAVFLDAVFPELPALEEPDLPDEDFEEDVPPDLVVFFFVPELLLPVLAIF